MLTIREFIYSDTERLKSIFSQVEKGLLTEMKVDKGNSSKVNGEMGTGSLLSALVDAKGMGELLFSNSESETKTLHDHMYNHIEEKLISENNIINIPGNTKKLPKDLKNNSFILLKGKIKIEDYALLSNKINVFNDLVNALNIVSNTNNRNLDDNFLNSLKLIVDEFYSNRLLVTSMPYEKNLNLRFIGPLNRNYLRDNIDNILFKFGAFPTMEWCIFGQISTILPKNHNDLEQIKDSKFKRIMKNYNEINMLISSADTYDMLVNENKKLWHSFNLSKEDFTILKSKHLENSFENIFKALDNLIHETGVKYPSIKFTPIAIYRE